LPWNTLIVAIPYLRSRLIGSPYVDSFPSWVTLVFTLFNLIFLAHANYTQQRANPTLRILGSILLITACHVALTVTTKIDIEPS
jgi:equilibrative nucleoside transporter 1/2/3